MRTPRSFSAVATVATSAWFPLVACCTLLLLAVAALPAVERTFGPYTSKPKEDPAKQKAAAEAAAKARREATLGYQVAQAEPLPDRIVATIDAGVVVDHRRLTGFDGPDQAARDTIADWGVLLAHCPGDTDFYEGLADLANRDQTRFGYDESRRPTRGFFKQGGFGRVLVGRKGEPIDRIEDFVDDIDRFEEHADVALLGMQAEDIDAGRRVQYTTKVYRVRLDIRSYKVSLQNSFTENINFITNQNGGLVAGNFPLELPNMEVAGLSTSVIVPAGQGLTTRRVLSPRYPGLTFAYYRDSMEALEKAYGGTRFVWATVPLEDDDNLQRNLYNTMVREYAAAHGKPLYDIAALQSHDDRGRLVQDEQGPRLAEVWRDGRYDHSLNEAGRQRIAEGWWAMLTELARP